MVIVIRMEKLLKLMVLTFHFWWSAIEEFKQIAADALYCGGKEKQLLGKKVTKTRRAIIQVFQRLREINAIDKNLEDCKTKTNKLIYEISKCNNSTRHRNKTCSIGRHSPKTIRINFKRKRQTH